MVDARIWMSIQGDGIYETIALPQIPRKGDVLWLRSLMGGGDHLPNEVLVSKVEWAMEQTTRDLHVWLTVRRIGQARHG